MKMEISKSSQLKTNKDARHSPRRRYRLSKPGLESLRSSAQKHQPWRSSTGPRTAAGKAASRMNAMKLGLFTQERLQANREMAELLRDMRRAQRPERLERRQRHDGGQLDAERDSSCEKIWIERLKVEMSDE